MSFDLAILASSGIGSIAPCGKFGTDPTIMIVLELTYFKSYFDDTTEASLTGTRMHSTLRYLQALLKAG